MTTSTTTSSQLSQNASRANLLKIALQNQNTGPGVECEVTMIDLMGRDLPSDLQETCLLLLGCGGGNRVE